MTLHLSPALEQRIAQAAELRGIKPEEYAQQLLEQSLPPVPSGRGILTKQDLADMLREMAEGSENLPVLPDEAFTRESIYGDHP